MSSLSRCCWLCLLAVFSSSGIAEESLESPWRLSGFLTQGWVASDNNNIFGKSSGSDGSFDYREIGVNGVYQMSSQLNFSGQFLSRQAGEVDDGDPKVDYLFGDWSFLQQMNRQAGVRLGRVKNPIGFYNDTRDVSFTRPSAILPQSIYLDLVREVQLSSDGVAFYGGYQSGHGSWMVDVVVGKPQSGTSSEYGFFRQDLPGTFDDGDTKLIRLLYEQGGGALRAGITWIDADFSFDSPVSGPIVNGKLGFRLWGASFQYNLERVSLTAEYVIEDIDRRGFETVFPTTENTLEAYYFQVEYRLNHQWTLLVRYDDVAIDEKERSGASFSGMSGPPDHIRFAEDWTLGASYQVTPRLLTRLELHHVNGTTWLPPQDNPSSSALKQSWNLLMFQASYRF